MCKKFCLTLLLFLLVLFFQNCAPKPVPLTKDDYKCPETPSGFFTASGVDISIANLEFKDFGLGKLDIKSNPEVISKYSEALQYESFILQSKCLAIKRDGWSDEQVAWLERLMRFFSLKPSPEEALKWRDKDPFPKNPAKLQGKNVIYNIAGDAYFNNDIEGAKNARKVITENIKADDNKKIRAKDYSGKYINLEDGKFYTSVSKKGLRVNYMLKDNQIHVETISGDGKTSYYQFDREMNLIDYKFPYKLEEYEVIIPENLELKRTETLLKNDYSKVHVKLKWGGFVDMILDGGGRLQHITIKGDKYNKTISNKKKTITVKLRDN